MGRIAGQVPAGRSIRRCSSRANISIASLNYPYAFHDEYPRSLQIVQIDDRGSVYQATDVRYSWPARPAQIASSGAVPFNRKRFGGHLAEDAAKPKYAGRLLRKPASRKKDKAGV